MYYRALTEDLLEPDVDFTLMNSPEYKQLSERPADMQIIPESALVGVGMSQIGDKPELRPVWTQDNKGAVASFVAISFLFYVRYFCCS
jgi:hypothetical protein